MIEKTSVQTGQDLPHRPFSPPEPLANGSSVAMRQVLGEKKRGDAPCGEERGRKAFIEDEFVNAEEDEQFPLRETLSTSSLVWSFFILLLVIIAPLDMFSLYKETKTKGRNNSASAWERAEPSQQQENVPRVFHNSGCVALPFSLFLTLLSPSRSLYF